MDPSTPLPPLPPLPPRDPAGHKGTFGTVCVLGGLAEADSTMLGSVVLATLGALRAGAALCIAAAPESLLPAILSANPSCTGLPLPVDAQGRLLPHRVAEALDAGAARAQVLAVGPGLGAGFAQQQVVMRIAAQELSRPVVLDADALNCLALTPKFDQDLRAQAVLTPHPGEYARLAAALGLHEDPVDPARRIAAAERLAQRVGAIVVLKGHRTVVSDGSRSWVCQHGDDALAIGGSGDVLTGVIAGLLAQYAATLGLFDCARLAVQAHALAGEAWAARAGGTAGMLAVELAAGIPEALGTMRRG